MIIDQSRLDIGRDREAAAQASRREPLFMPLCGHYLEPVARCQRMGERPFVPPPSQEQNRRGRLPTDAMLRELSFRQLGYGCN